MAPSSRTPPPVPAAADGSQAGGCGSTLSCGVDICHFERAALFHFSSVSFSFLNISQVPVDVEVAKQASLYHQVALVLLPWLLPGSEYLAHELLSTVIFNKDFIS